MGLAVDVVDRLPAVVAGGGYAEPVFGVVARIDLELGAKVTRQPHAQRDQDRVSRHPFVERPDPLCPVLRRRGDRPAVRRCGRGALLLRRCVRGALLLVCLRGGGGRRPLPGRGHESVDLLFFEQLAQLPHRPDIHEL